LEGHGKTGRVRGQPSLIFRDRAMDPLGFKAVLPLGVRCHFSHDGADVGAGVSIPCISAARQLDIIE